jgi:hypothetical protein
MLGQLSLKSMGPPGMFQYYVAMEHHAGGGVEACPIEQERGKENLDPTPQPKQNRRPRAKKVIAALLVLSVWWTAHSLLLPDDDAPVTDIVVVASVLLLTATAGGSLSVEPGSVSGCVPGLRPEGVHAAPFHSFEDGLETPEEPTSGEGIRRGGGGRLRRGHRGLRERRSWQHWSAAWWT